MNILKSIAPYFALVFGAGFIFGTIRVPFLVRRFGERVAVLIETPFKRSGPWRSWFFRGA